MTKPAETAATAPTSTIGDLPREIVHRAAWKAGVLGALNLLTRVLNARVIVLLTVGGGIMLAHATLGHSDWYSLAVLGVYCLGVVFPVAFLAAWWR